MARRKKYEEPENLERWLVSYADFITLLFAFFVVLYAMSSVNEGKYKILTESLLSAFEKEPRSMNPIEVGAIKIVREQITAQETPPNPAHNERLADGEYKENLKTMAEQIKQAMAGLMDQGLISVSEDGNWLEVEMKTDILFGSGSAELSPQAVPVLRQIAAILRPFPNPVNVEGFTDSVPIHTPEFPSNWELSAARASSVVRILQAGGVDPKRMAAIGYGQYRPIADNSTPEGRNKNRRVVLAISAHDTAKERKALNPQAFARGEGLAGRLLTPAPGTKPAISRGNVPSPSRPASP